MSIHNVLRVHKAAVLGSGVMGAQIAAHFVNSGVNCLLLDLKNPKEGDPNKIIKDSLAKLKKLEPAPFGEKDTDQKIEIGNFDEDLEKLKECDLIIEAVTENFDIKKSLYEKIQPFLNPGAILATNTSGISLGVLAKILSPERQKRFCGVHFFNPPRYMTLVELIPQPAMESGLLDVLEEFFTTVIGKGVVRAKDTPNFIANRIGVFSLLGTVAHTEKLGLGFDVVDLLTGPLLGRPKSATYRTLDVVGLDTFAHVVENMANNLKSDPWLSYYVMPKWANDLIAKGSLGQKTRIGVYHKTQEGILVFDPKLQNYRPCEHGVSKDIEEIFKFKSLSQKLKSCRVSSNPQAQLIWGILRDLFHYCAVHLEEIADTARDLDLAMRWGYGWDYGPFELWQMAEWEMILAALEEDMKAQKTLSQAPIPAWVKGRKLVHFPEGSFSPQTNAPKTPAPLPVYEKQFYREDVIPSSKKKTALFENSGVELSTYDGKIGVLNFKTKMNCIGSDVLEGIMTCVQVAEAGLEGLIVWQPKPPFSVGANLKEVMELAKTGRFDDIEHMIFNFQQATMALKYSLVPTVAAVQGMALGGGCEVMMHCSHTVAHLETYAGLVEAGVGLIPGGGGSKELCIRAAKKADGHDLFPWVKKYFENVAKGQVSKSAYLAKDMGLLRESDHVLMNKNELLYVAHQEVEHLSRIGYRPPLRHEKYPVLGKPGVATLKAGLYNMAQGGFISEYDYSVAGAAAIILCGGEVDGGSLVSEDWLLFLERELFMSLVQNPQTLARMEHMIQTGKPLRN